MGWIEVFCGIGGAILAFVGYWWNYPVLLVLGLGLSVVEFSLWMHRRKRRKRERVQP